MTELGGVVVAVPLRGLDNGKTRLAAVLPAETRAALTRRMLRRVVRAAAEVAGVRAVAVVSPDPQALVFATEVHHRVVDIQQDARAAGLNAAAAAGRAWAIEEGAAACLVLFADLPLLTATDVRCLLDEPSEVTIATDRHGAGTNALLLRLEGGVAGPASRFRFGFGEGSAARHAAEASRLGLTCATVHRRGIGFDLDTAEDWRLLLGKEESSLATGDGALAGLPVLLGEFCSAGEPR